MLKTNTVTHHCKYQSFATRLFVDINHNTLLINRHAAASYGEMEVLEFLLSVGANVQLRDEDGDTPLLVSEKPEIFQRLIQAGADPLATNTNGQGILQKAVEDDNEELINFLRENGYITDPNFKYTPGQSEMEEFLDMLEPVAEGEGNNEENDDAEDADMDEAGN